MKFRTHNAIRYTLEHLFRIACGRKVDLRNLQVVDGSVHLMIEDLHLAFRMCSDEDFDRLLKAKLPLDTVDAFDSHHKIPIINPDHRPLFRRENSRLFIEADIISLPFILLSSLDELLSTDKDAHDRVRYENSLMCKYGLSRIPLVDEYAFLLRRELEQLISVESHKTQIIATHDIDETLRYPDFKSKLRAPVGALRRGDNLKKIGREIVRSSRDHTLDPYYRGVAQLSDDAHAAGLQSVFFFPTARRGKHDRNLPIDNPVLQPLFERLRRNGAEIGIHPGYETFRGANEMRRQVRLLENAFNDKITCSRQHYLRIDLSQTFDHLQDCGIETDYTMGFAAEEGFRNGTSHPFHPYDFAADAPYRILCKPLTAMDVTLWQYKQYNRTEALASLQSLLATIRRVQGDFVVLWHNQYVIDNDWYAEVYRRFLGLA